MNSLLQTIKPMRDRRFLTIFILGFSSGFPWALHGSVLTLWLQSEGLSRSEIGFIGIVTAIYAFNWLWSPLVDSYKLPLLYRLFGRRRSWILFTQGLLFIFILLLSTSDPASDMLVVGILALGVSLASATQDIAVDAYRVNLFSKQEFDVKLPYASAFATIGWMSGYSFIGGALALWLGGETLGLQWPTVYRILASIYLLLMVFVILSPQIGNKDNTDTIHSDVPTMRPAFSLQKWLFERVATPFVEFFNRCGIKLAVAILLFLFSFRMGEAMLGRMSLLFYRELGFTTEQIALYSKFLGGLATVVYALLAAVLNSRYGVMRGMLVGGIAMAATNLLYAVMAQVGPVPWLFMVTLLLDNFSGAFSTVAVLSFMAYFTSQTYTGTQFALMTSISNFGRTTLAASSGAIVDGMDGNWSLFFIMTTLIVIPALLLLLWMGKMLGSYSAKRNAVF